MDYMNGRPQQVTTNNDTSAPPIQQSPRPKKKRLKKLLLFIILLLLLAGGGVFARQTLSKKEVNPGVSSNPSTTDQTTILPDNRLFFQLGKKVIAYDAKTKKTETLTDKLSDGTRVIDVYANSNTWRLYAEKPNESKAELLFLEKGKDVQTLTEIEAGAFPVQANAKHKLVAYSVIAPNDNKSKGTQTYIYSDDKKEVVYESEPLTEGSNTKGLKDPRYLMNDVSPDAKKLLFTLANCLYCDGGVSATSFELDLASKKASTIYSATKNQGETSYNSQTGSYQAAETSTPALGFSEGPYDLTLSSPAKAGGDFVKFLELKESKWANVVYEQNGANFFAAETKGATFTEDGKTVFDAMYSRGNAPDAREKLTVKDLPTSTHIVVEIGSLPFEAPDTPKCFGIVLNDRTANSGQAKTATYKIGALCTGSGNNLTYTEIDSLTYNPSDYLTQAQVFSQ